MKATFLTLRTMGLVLLLAGCGGSVATVDASGTLQDGATASPDAKVVQDAQVAADAQAVADAQVPADAQIAPDAGQLLADAGEGPDAKIQNPPDSGGSLFEITSTSPPAGMVQGTYRYLLAASGGTGSLTWCVVAGATCVTTGSPLPPGIVVGPGAAPGSSSLNGPPTAAGVYPFTLKVTDQAQQVATAEVSVTVLAGAPDASVPYDGSVASELIILTTSLPSATKGAAYSASITATLGVAPYKCSATVGAPPAGINLSGGSNGCSFNGAPTDVGAVEFTVQVSDSNSPPSTASRHYSIAVFPALDAYGGLNATAAPGCTASGYFQTVKSGGRWWICDPLGKVFYQTSVYHASKGFLDPTAFNSRFAGNNATFATRSLDRLLAAGFNSLDIYSDSYFLPIGTYGAASGASPKVPFALFYNAMNDAFVHPDMVGLLEPIKDLCAGQAGNAYGYQAHGGWCGFSMDAMDPRWLQATAAEYSHVVCTSNCGSYGTGEFAGGFENSPWLISISLGDSSNISIFTGNGASSVTYPHPAQIVATDSFVYSAAQCATQYRSGDCIDHVLHSKHAWADGETGVDFGYGAGKGYLSAKYGTIAALNTAWSTGGFYTSFGDAGGYGAGTGILDEDGRHVAWFGHVGTKTWSDFENQTGMNANLKADLDQFLEDMTARVYLAQANAIRTAPSHPDTHHQLMCGTFGGALNGGARLPVLKGLAKAGCSILGLNWQDKDQASSIAVDRAEYDAVGLPAVLWFSVTAKADSSVSSGTSGSGLAHDYGTQDARGAAYAQNVATIASLAGTNGDKYTLGIMWWEMLDNTSEHDDWGLMSIYGDPYDGRCAIQAAGTDAWGTQCGGEAANYGDFLDAATQANVQTLQSL